MGTGQPDLRQAICHRDFQQAKSRKEERMSEEITCDYCGAFIKPEFGEAVCISCGETRCVEFCIPGGNRTECTECEEAKS
jgi:hypothetical protein